MRPIPLVACLLVPLLGCDRIEEFKKKTQSGESTTSPSESMKVAPKPLTISWAERKATLSDGKETIEVLGTKTELSITFHDFATGTKYTLGEKNGAIDSSVYSMTRLDVRSKLGPLRLDSLKEVDFKIELSLSLPDGRSGKTMLPPVYFDYGLREVLQGAENGPVLFGEEAVDAKSDDCLVWPTSSEIEPYGACTTVQNIDFVAVSHVSSEEKGRRTCSGYKGNDGKPAPDLTVVSKETEVTIFERRTGRVVEKKSFAPDKDCPMFAMTSSNDDHTMDAYPDTDAIKAWLRTKPKR